ncbi:hypothetical protein ACEW7V_01340 [Areca yellow leaf disease phytoplasma]|uniref:hypothetical protein n=1 Tax=Areca yellow leaf disease phytoplasma TaxID=927614 RepID=UPI0035B53854
MEKLTNEELLSNFLADPEIFQETTIYNFDTLKERMQQLSFLNKGLKLNIADKRYEKETVFNFCHEKRFARLPRFY